VEADKAKYLSIIEVLYRRRMFACAVLAVGVVLSVAFAFIIKPKYSATAHVLLVNDQQGRDPKDESLDMPSIATSTTVLESVRERLNLIETVDDLKKDVSVKVAPKSSVMSVSAKDHDPVLAVRISNTLAEAFTSFYQSVSGGRYREVITELQRDLTLRRARVLVLESRLQRAASRSAYVGSQASLDNMASSLSSLVTQRALAYAQLISDRSALGSAQADPRGKLSRIIRHEMLANDQNYHVLEIHVSHDVAEFKIQKASYTDRFPGLPGERAKLDGERVALNASAAAALSGPAAYSPSLAGQIVEEQRARSAVDGDETRVSALDDQIDDMKRALRELPSSGVGVGALRALRDTEEAQYQSLALRLSNAEANSAEANSLGSVIVVDRPTIADPNLLTTNLLLTLFLLVSIGLAIGAAYLGESIDPRLISKKDVESIYGRPVLGSLNGD
jgi:uncharacterized protein involved in exopolysaccharide biosynthesis